MIVHNNTRRTPAAFGWRWMHELFIPNLSVRDVSVEDAAADVKRQSQRDGGPPSWVLSTRSHPPSSSMRSLMLKSPKVLARLHGAQAHQLEALPLILDRQSVNMFSARSSVKSALSVPHASRTLMSSSRAE
jgi:hypothetical protein